MSCGRTLGGRTRCASSSKGGRARPAYTLRAALVYEHGGAVEELSTTLEPALLGGEAVLKDGVASFKLRISVLSSLCQMKRFRVQVTCVERPELAPVATAPVRTITKLRRGPREPVAGREAEAEAGAGLLGAGAGGLGGRADEGGKRSLESLWDEVSTNGQLLLELQKQQRLLFRELRRIRETRAGPADADHATDHPLDQRTFLDGLAEHADLLLGMPAAPSMAV